MSTIKPTSITSFADDQIINDARILGVSLGVSLSECIKSAKLIKNFEKQRSITLLKGNDTQSQKCLLVSRASDLCDDLEAEEEFWSDENIEIPKVITRERKTRKKSLMIKKMLGGVIELDLNHQNYNDKS
jgi:hypothetical protein